MQYVVLVSLLCVIGLAAFRSMSHPTIALSVVCSTFALEQLLQSFFPVFIRHSSLLNIAIGVFVLVALAVGLHRGKLTLSTSRTPKLYFGTLFFMVYVVCSIMWSPDPDGSWSLMLRPAPYIVLFCFITPFCVETPEELNRAIQYLIVIGVVVCAGIIFSKIGWRGVVLDRVSGKNIEGNPLAIASFANLVALAATFSIYQSNSQTKRILYVVAIALCVYTMVRSGSRGQSISYFLVAIIWLPIAAKIHSKRSPLPALIIIGIMGVLAAFFVKEIGMTSRFGQTQLFRDGGGRLSLAYELFGDYIDAGPFTWLFGLGNGASHELIGFYPHIVPIEVLCEEGIVGLGIMVILLVKIFRRGYSIVRDPYIALSTRNSMLLLLAGLTNFLILSLKEGNLLGTFPMIFMFGLVIEFTNFKLRDEPNYA